MLKHFRSKLSGLVWAPKRFGSSLERPTKNTEDPSKSEYYMAMEYDWGCHNYHPIPVVIAKAKGINVWDVEGNKYFDFLSAYSAVNQGHCHPKIYKTFAQQAKILHLTSRAFYNNQLGIAEKFMAQTFGFEKTLFMNTGVEAGESALKIARRWAYVRKGVPDDQAAIVFAKGNFWGRTIAACASSDDPERYHKFGPFGGLNFHLVPFNDANALEQYFNSNPNVAAFMVEPIQGEAGVIYPDQGYLKKVKVLCKKHNVLLICDEIQTGLGRTGKLLATDWDNIKPDIVLLGKALSGGFMPVSAVLTSREIMDVIKPGDHGSTYGGNPLAAATSKRAIEVLLEEKMVENSLNMGTILEKELKSIKRDFIVDVRAGKGLFAAIEFDEKAKFTGWEFAMKLKENGLLAKPTHGTTIRFAPPLVITEKELEKCVKIIKKTIGQF